MIPQTTSSRPSIVGRKAGTVPRSSDTVDAVGSRSASGTQKAASTSSGQDQLRVRLERGDERRDPDRGDPRAATRVLAEGAEHLAVAIEVETDLLVRLAERGAEQPVVPSSRRPPGRLM